MAILSLEYVKMTSILERAIAIIAPHRCFVCSNYNNILCDSCIHELPRLETPCCVLCGDTQVSWQICSVCRKDTSLAGVWVASEYEDVVKKAIRAYKFEHARAARKPLASLLVQALPHLDDTWVISTIPTVSQHVRARSFDHARLLAQEVAQQKGLLFKDTLLRKQNVQQVGENRAQRFAQAQNMFELSPGVHVKGIRVLIVDDVCTTGATLSAAAAMLTQAGASEVWGAVVAWKRLKDSEK